MLGRVKKIYQYSQNEHFSGSPGWEPHSSTADSVLSFKLKVYVYLSVLLFGAIAYFLSFISRWSDDIQI